MDIVNLESTVRTANGERGERFGVDPHPVPIASDSLDAGSTGIRTPLPHHESSFDVESVVSGSALVAMLFFIALLVLGALDAGLVV